MNTPYISVNPNGYENQFVSRKRSSFNDKRLENVWIMYSKRLIQSQSAVIKVAAKNTAEIASIKRFLVNKKVQADELIQKSCEISQDSIRGQRLIVYGDTTNISLKKQTAHLTDSTNVGFLDDNKTRGFHAHINLVAKQKNGQVLGLSDIILSMRPKKNHRNRAEKSLASRTQSFTQKESYRWVLGVQNSLRLLKSAEQTVFVFDREADSFDIFYHLKEAKKADFIIRANHNRFVLYTGEKMKVSEAISQSEILGTHKIVVKKQNHRSKTGRKQVTRKKRTAQVEIRAMKVKIAPTTQQNKEKRNVLLALVEVRETGNKLPKGEKPILWRLWTTLPVRTFEDAKKIVKFYSWRWNIEQLFRIVKKKGFALQSTELKTFEAISKLTIMILKSASVVLQLIRARDDQNAQPIEDVFTQEEIEVLKKLNIALQGKTKLLKNNNPPDRLSWAAWVVARLGSWHGYNSQGLPGPITYKRGLEKFLVYVDASRIL